MGNMNNLNSLVSQNTIYDVGVTQVDEKFHSNGSELHIWAPSEIPNEKIAEWIFWHSPLGAVYMAAPDLNKDRVEITGPTNQTHIIRFNRHYTDEES